MHATPISKFLFRFHSELVAEQSKIQKRHENANTNIHLTAQLNCKNLFRHCAGASCSNAAIYRANFILLSLFFFLVSYTRLVVFDKVFHPRSPVVISLYLFLLVFRTCMYPTVYTDTYIRKTDNPREIVPLFSCSNKFSLHRRSLHYLLSTDIHSCTPVCIYLFVERYI